MIPGKVSENLSFLCAVVIIKLCFFTGTTGLPAVDGVNKSAIEAKIYVVDHNNRILRPWTRINKKSETVLQDVDRIRLECTSDVYPVQWLYFGHGAPILTSNVTFTRMKSRSGEASIEYVASALISPAKEHHTGKYICSGTQNFDTRTFFYIYVPGPTLFSALNGQDIYLPKNDTNILIPCTVSNPDVIVTLEKSINDVLQRINPSLVSYDPKEGIRLDIKELTEPEGIYACTARYKNLVRGIEYTLRYPTSPFNDAKPKNSELAATGTESATCEMKCGENAHCEVDASSGKSKCVCNHHFKGNPTEACNLDCRSHSDCPQNTVCFSDLKCRDPCVHSIRCGPGALCRVTDSYPVCYCAENFVGDPKVGCINALQQDSPVAPSVPSAINSTNSKCSRNCGNNAYCTIQRGKEACKCKPGLVECDIPCTSHDDCPDDLSCNVLLKCHSPCIHNLRCGIGAQCTTASHRPKCHCPKDTTGDPMNECSSEFQGDQPPPSSPSDSGPAPVPDKNTTTEIVDKCKRNNECASHEKCMKADVDKGKECLDPCKTRRCGSDALCLTEDHYTFCVCKNGFEGNANKECRPIKFQEGFVEPLRQKPSVSSSAQAQSSSQEKINCTKPEECGPFSSCILDKDGKQKCGCLEGYRGAPPNCTKECERNSDCLENHVCLRDTRIDFPYCARVCGKRICGVNAICREANGVIPADCECPVGTGGDALLSCHNLNAKLGEDCQIDRDCGTSARCETGAQYRKCVDPCKKLQCGDRLECSVIDHRASCVCQSGYTGNPSIGCTKDADFNITAISENGCEKLTCGPHSECRLDLNGEASCSCRSYAKGEPPSCYEECNSNSDCEVGLSCVQKQCRHSCSRCGLNTKCLISRSPQQESVCSCLEGFEGDPKRGCRPIRS